MRQLFRTSLLCLAVLTLLPAAAAAQEAATITGRVTPVAHSQGRVHQLRAARAAGVPRDARAAATTPAPAVRRRHAPPPPADAICRRGAPRLGASGDRLPTYPQDGSTGQV